MDTIRVQHIDHVTIVVRDLNRSREFYVGLLGMEEVDRPSFSFAGAWFKAGPPARVPKTRTTCKLETQQKGNKEAVTKTQAQIRI